MGAPSRDWFCENGHIVEHYCAHTWVNEEGKMTCPACGSDRTKCVLDWGETLIVPLEKIGMNWYTVSVPVYDVSKLFND